MSIIIESTSHSPSLCVANSEIEFVNAVKMAVKRYLVASKVRGKAL